jgi:hypothetical protein
VVGHIHQAAALVAQVKMVVAMAALTAQMVAQQQLTLVAEAVDLGERKQQQQLPVAMVDLDLLLLKFLIQ